MNEQNLAKIVMKSAGLILIFCLIVLLPNVLSEEKTFWGAGKDIGRKVIYKTVEKGIKPAGRAALKIGTKYLGKVSGEKFAKGASKFGKTAGKYVPGGVGATVGAIEAIRRVKHGEYIKGGMEAASGAASIFPGVGTYASYSIDAAIAAHDLYEATKGKKQD